MKRVIIISGARSYRVKLSAVARIKSMFNNNAMFHLVQIPKFDLNDQNSITGPKNLSIYMIIRII